MKRSDGKTQDTVSSRDSIFTVLVSSVLMVTLGLDLGLSATVHVAHCNFVARKSWSMTILPVWNWSRDDCLAALDGLHRQQVVQSGDYREQIALLTELCTDKDDEVLTERQRLVNYKKSVALAAVNSRSGRPIPPQVKAVLRVVWKSSLSPLTPSPLSLPSFYQTHPLS